MDAGKWLDSYVSIRLRCCDCPTSLFRFTVNCSFTELSVSTTRREICDVFLIIITQLSMDREAAVRSAIEASGHSGTENQFNYSHNGSYPLLPDKRNRHQQHNRTDRAPTHTTPRTVSTSTNRSSSLTRANNNGSTDTVQGAIEWTYVG
jgi:hypothetical protein